MREGPFCRCREGGRFSPNLVVAATAVRVGVEVEAELDDATFSMK